MEENHDKNEELAVSRDIVRDARNIADGVYAPLTGFLRQDDFLSVLGRMRLANGTVWTIPIVIPLTEEDRVRLKRARRIKLVDKSGRSWAILEDPEIYRFEKEEMARRVFGTADINHPGVAAIKAMGDYLLGGDIVKTGGELGRFSDYRLTPEQTKEIFRGKGWKTVVAFQTRNVPHRGHEFLQKHALKSVDGLFIQPVIGEKKLADFKDEYIISAYKTLLEKYYPRNRTLLGVLPLKMRYAGPREAVMHALIRRNFGCTHFIVGRDHAGVGNYYHPTAAQEIFDRFSPDDINIEILKYGEVVYDRSRGKHCFAGECREEDRLGFSGTKLRNFIKNREKPPAYLIRPEVYNLLTNSQNSLVDPMYKENTAHRGFVLWLTGLSGAGKTTIADALDKILSEKNIKTERLDGDVVREHLTKDLGFSRKDRDENIRRVGFVAGLLARNGVGVIASFISPYRRQRDELRGSTHNFIEVFVDAPLAVCEERDPKGMYKKARSGEIKAFTGVSDPYEAPEKAEIHIKTHEADIEESVEAIIEYLRQNRFIR